MDRKYMEAPGAGRFAMRLGMRNYLEILEPVVIFYTIAVMNPLLSIKNTAKMLLHNETMLKYVTNFIPMWMLGRHNFYVPSMNLNTPSSPIRAERSLERKFFISRPNGSPSFLRSITCPRHPVSFSDCLVAPFRDSGFMLLSVISVRWSS